LVFGFNDDLTKAAVTEFPGVDRDAVAGVVKSYLDPAFQCDVRVVVGESGARHTLVVVPSHGPLPICAKRDGPQDAKGRSQGIKSGTYYIRKPGPASEPILTPIEWAPLLRRCVLAERAAILGAIDMALKGERSEDAIETGLRRWHEVLLQSYRERLASAGREQALANGYTQFSFAVHHSGGGVANDDLLRVVERCNAEADAITRMHWGPFPVIHRDPKTPRFRTVSDLDNGECEFLEASLILEEIGNRSMWRVSGDGFGSLIKGWREDSPSFRKEPQSCLSPLWLSTDVASCVLFARAFANNFEAATAVTFRCEWTGLKNRKPFDHDTRVSLNGHPAQDEGRISHKTISLAELNSGWEIPAAALIGPVARAVGASDLLTAERLTRRAAGWMQRD
jgi:hypothetical protein